MLTREEILAKKVGERVVTLPSGGEVRVRGLTRDEALKLQEQGDTAARDNFLIATGMLEPQLSVDDVAAWAAGGGAGDTIEISRAISELSGMGEGAGKSGVPAARKRSRS